MGRRSGGKTSQDDILPPWLGVDRLHGTRVPFLVESRQLEELTNRLPDPRGRMPVVLHLVGGRTKMQFLRSQASAERWSDPVHIIRSSRMPSLSVLRGTDRNPLMLLSSDPLTPDPPRGPNTEHWQTDPIDWASRRSLEDIQDTVQSCVIRPFTDVICMFADDLGGESSVVALLEKWAKTTVLYKKTLPQVLVASRRDHRRLSFDVATTDLPLGLTGQSWALLKKSYRGVHCFKASGGGGPRLTELYRSLWGFIDQALTTVREERGRHGELFNAIHLYDMLKRAKGAFLDKRLESFNFVRESREDYPVGASMAGCISAFIRTGLDQMSRRESLFDYVALTMVVKAYPPDMHAFHPADVFDTLYSSVCQAALDNVSGLDASEAIETLKGSFCHLALQLKDRLALDIFVLGLRGLAISWTLIKASYCLYCLEARFSKRLRCGHPICEVCVRHYGRLTGRQEENFHLDRCLLCRGGGLTTVVRPVTAHPRVLTLDGGGTRAIITLNIILQFQELLGPTCLVQDLFDVVCGTSVGAIIALLLVHRRLSITECIKSVTGLCEEVFPNRWKDMPVLTHIIYLLRSFRNDGLHDPRRLVAVLEKVIGHGELDDLRDEAPMSALGIVASSLDAQAEPVVFTNVSGIRANEEAGVRYIVSTQDLGVKAVDALRCSTAAPVFYPMGFVPGFNEHLQDGGMSGRNNPIGLACLLVSSLVGMNPSSDKFSDQTSATSVSIGTGTPSALRIRRARESLYPKAGISRIINMFNGAFDGDQQFRTAQQQHGRSRGRWDNMIRLNVLLDSAHDVRLDDTSCMAGLAALTRSDRFLRREVEKAVFSTLASTFYFKPLHRGQRSEHGPVTCHGVVCWRRLPEEVDLLTARWPSLNIALEGNDTRSAHRQKWVLKSPSRPALRLICWKCKMWRLPVTVLFGDAAQSFALSLTAGEDWRHYISGFPNSFGHLIDLQCGPLYGSVNHFHEPVCEACHPTSRKRRSGGALVKRRLRRRTGEV